MGKQHFIMLASECKCEELSSLRLKTSHELLLKYGARINSRDNKGNFIMLVFLHTIKLLLKYGARVNSQDNYGRTALHYACFKGHILAVDELLKHGSDINVMSKKGRTALCGINRYSGGKIA